MLLLQIFTTRRGEGRKGMTADNVEYKRPHDKTKLN